MWLLFSYYSRWAPLGGDCSPVETVDVEGLLISHHNNTRKQTCWEECQQRREGPTLPGGASLGLFPLVVLDFWMERSERCSLKGGSCWIRLTFSLFFWRYDVCDKSHSWNLENMETLSFSGAVMFLFGRIQTLHPSFETLYLFMLHCFILKVMLRHLTEKTEDSRAEHNLSHLVIIIDYYIEIT